MKVNNLYFYSEVCGYFLKCEASFLFNDTNLTFPSDKRRYDLRLRILHSSCTSHMIWNDAYEVHYVTLLEARNNEC